MKDITIGNMDSKVYDPENKQKPFTTNDSFKTINNESLLGSGNIEISGGGGGGFLREISIAGTQYVNTILFEGAIGKATTLSAGYITLLTAPTGANFVITIYKSTDSGATYPTTETITLTATNKYVKGTLTLAFAEGDFMKAVITSVGSSVSGSNLLFSITGT